MKQNLKQEYPSKQRFGKYFNRFNNMAKNSSPNIAHSKSICNLFNFDKLVDEGFGIPSGFQRRIGKKQYNNSLNKNNSSSFQFI